MRICTLKLINHVSGKASLIKVHLIVDAHLYTEIDKGEQLQCFVFAEFINNLAFFLKRVRFYCVMISTADC